jgi:diaminopimelate epimerase
MRFAITKCHGSGNDFPMIDARGIDLSDHGWAAVARALADRAGPVGGDGLLLFTAGDEEKPIGFRMFNSDGSEAETCLNGVRCVARMGFEALERAVAGVRLTGSEAWVERDDDLAPGVYTVAETAGPATLRVADWPLAVAAEQVIEAVVPPLGDRLFTAVRIPNPHLVSFVDMVDEGELVRLGRLCEAAPDWLPNRANVSFVVARRDGDGVGELFVRTFERGVGLTNSCGSAMAASTYAACLTGRLRFGETATVYNRGGLVRATADDEGMITLSGNATFEWRGAVTVADGRASDLVVTERFADEVAAWAGIAAKGAAFA